MYNIIFLIVELCKSGSADVKMCQVEKSARLESRPHKAAMRQMPESLCCFLHQ